MDEYGIFNDEGCVERQFFSRTGANIALAGSYTKDVECWVAVMCHDHVYEEMAADGCELCDDDTDEDEDEDDES